MRVFAVFLMAFLLAVPARAGVRGPGSCDSDNARCRWDQSGAAPVEFFTDGHYEVFRFRVAGFRIPEMIYQILRSASGSVLLHMREAGGAITYPANPTVWSEVLARWQKFKREEDAFIAEKTLRKAHPKLRKFAPNGEEVEDVVVCADGYGIDFQTVLAGKITDRSPETCAHPLVDALYQNLQSYLLAQVPFCAGIAEDIRPVCFKLEGDRYRASEIMAPLFKLADYELCRPAGLVNVAPLFAPDVVVRVAGEAWPSDEPARRFIDMSCGKDRRYLGFDVAEGRPDGSVVVTGTMEFYQGPDGDRHDYLAPYTQAWRSVDGKTYRIAQWTVDAPVRMPD